MTPDEAFAAIALVAIACDGSMDRREAEALRHQLDMRTPFRDLSDDVMGNLFERLLEQIRDQGWERLITEAVGQLTLAQQETALAMAAQLVRCDGAVDPAEAAMLSRMASQLKLSESRAAQILDVIDVLNRDSLASE
ncbi:MAG: tellurite resistance TerB family protein [Cyanobacteriota bacterium]|nr:tellurite resistance TerB family protein [Cyanobacteriota bacterium]